MRNVDAGGAARQAGFAILEVLVAVAVFLAFYLAVMDVSAQGARGAALARNRLRATTIAEQQMDYALYQMSFDFNWPNQPTYTQPFTMVDTVNNVTRTIRFDTTVNQPVLVSGTTDLKDVVVVVQWTEGKLTHNVRLESIAFNP